jgi:hypothetical protein
MTAVKKMIVGVGDRNSVPAARAFFTDDIGFGHPAK